MLIEYIIYNYYSKYVKVMKNYYLKYVFLSSKHGYLKRY